MTSPRLGQTHGRVLFQGLGVSAPRSVFTCRLEGSVSCTSGRTHAVAASSARRPAGARHLRPRATIARSTLLGLARSEHSRGRRHQSVAAPPALVRTTCLRVGPGLFPAAAPGSLAGTARGGCDDLAGYYHARRPRRADIGDAGWCRGDSGDAGRGVGDRRRDDSSRWQKGLAHVPAQLPQTQAQAWLYEVRRCTLARPAT